MRGLFITFEGLDGCGKTTQIKLLKDYLEGQGRKVVLTREPGGTKISEDIRDIILDVANKEMSYTCEMLLYAAARAQLVQQVIKPSLEEGAVVLCDRFVDSSYVYQGFARGLGIEKVHKINQIAMDEVAPDITLFFDITPEVSLQRRMKVSTGDRIEKEQLEFHQKVYEGYKYLASKYPDRIKIIDANCEIEEVRIKVLEKIEKIVSTVNLYGKVNTSSKSMAVPDSK